ncbi:MAG: dihydrodipicolinate synthase family protein [Clostridiales bacterium]|nr:dihydrodipicolinate synthase family protein [Clostridiales bacterium]
MIKKRYEDIILATACIPWNDKYEFQKQSFAKQINNLIDNGITHIYLFGTAGEGYAVNHKQFEEIVSYYAKLMDSKSLQTMVGLIDLSPQRMQEKINIAKKYGITDFQFSLPSWQEVSDVEIRSLMDELLGKNRDCNFLLYNLTRVKRFLPAKLLIQLANEYENFIAVKHTRLSDEDIEVLSNEETPLQFFLTENNFAKLSEYTDCSLLISIGNLDLSMIKQFQIAVKNHDKELVSSYLEKINTIHTKMKEIITGPYIDGAYDKLYVKYNINDFSTRLLPPYQSPPLEQILLFEQMVKETL